MQARRKILERERCTPRDDDHVLNGVLQLTDVAGPSVVHQYVQSLALDSRDGLLVDARELAHEVVDDQRDVLPSLA